MASLQCSVPSGVLLPKPTGMDVLQLLAQILHHKQTDAELCPKTCGRLVCQVGTASVCGVEPHLLPSLAQFARNVHCSVKLKPSQAPAVPKIHREVGNKRAKGILCTQNSRWLDVSEDTDKPQHAQADSAAGCLYLGSESQFTEAREQCKVITNFQY